METALNNDFFGGRKILLEPVTSVDYLICLCTEETSKITRS